jgi:hypothetical protein
MPQTISLQGPDGSVAPISFRVYDDGTARFGYRGHHGHRWYRLNSFAPPRDANPDAWTDLLCSAARLTSDTILGSTQESAPLLFRLILASGILSAFFSRPETRN